VRPQEYLDAVQGRSKEKRYTFDVALGQQVGAARGLPAVRRL
jgi:hypothetical protein